MTQPTIYLTNWSSKKLYGPGRKFTIMAAPRWWEHGDGTVQGLVPSLPDLLGYRTGQISLAEYNTRYIQMVRPNLATLTPEGPVLKDGDTLCCACSRDVAAKGACHRVWAATLLREAGWRVILDGAEI